MRLKQPAAGRLFGGAQAAGAISDSFLAGGRYSNAKLDELIDAIRVEPDIGKRRQLVGDALRVAQGDLALIPLYRRHLTWVMRPGVSVVSWPNDVLELRWVQVD